MKKTDEEILAEAMCRAELWVKRVHRNHELQRQLSEERKEEMSEAQRRARRFFAQMNKQTWFPLQKKDW